MDRKKEIIIATLELSANKGLGTVSMKQIADKVGMKKDEKTDTISYLGKRRFGKERVYCYKIFSIFFLWLVTDWLKPIYVDFC